MEGFTVEGKVERVNDGGDGDDGLQGDTVTMELTLEGKDGVRKAETDKTGRQDRLSFFN